MKKKIISWMVLSAIILSSVSCGETVKSEDDNSDITSNESSSETVVETEENKRPDFLPDNLKYGGQEFRFINGETGGVSYGESEIAYMLDDVEPGNPVHEAVYERTRMAEETLDINVVSETIGDGNVSSRLSASVLAKDDDFQAICAKVCTLGSIVSTGYLYDILSVNTLDLTNTWWDQQVNDSMTIANKQFLTSGDLNYADDYGIYCVMFNKNLFDQRNIAYPYDLVRANEWTFDKFYTIIKDAAEDVNNDGVYDQNDFYGYVGLCYNTAAFMIGFGEDLFIRDDEGYYIVNNFEPIVNKCLEVTGKMNNINSVLIVERKLGYGVGDTLFQQDKSLMAQGIVGGIVGMRESMESDFGILPYPLYDETQDGYHHVINQHWSSALAVPVTCSDSDMLGYVLDTMGYFSPDTITKNVINKNATIRSVRDEDSAQMLKLIFETKEFDLAFVFNWGNYMGAWYDFTILTTPRVSSVFAAIDTRVNKEVRKVIDNISEFKS